jgi:hypothetical protein
MSDGEAAHHLTSNVFQLGMISPTPQTKDKESE